MSSNRRRISVLPAVAVAATLTLAACGAPGPPISVARAEGDVVTVAADRDQFIDAVGGTGGAAAGDAGDGGETRAAGESFYYHLEPPLSPGDGGAVSVSTAVLPGGTRVRLFEADGEELPSVEMTSAPAGLAVERIERVLSLPSDREVAGFVVELPTDWELPEDRPEETLLTLASAERFHGAAILGTALRSGASSSLSVTRTSAVEWEVSLAPDAEGGRLEIDYVVDAQMPGDRWATVDISGAGSGVSYRARLDAGAGTIALPAASLGFIPTAVRVGSVDEGFAVRRVQWHASVARRPARGPGTDDPSMWPIPADLSTILSSYPQSAWRREAFEVFSWTAYPQVLVFDTADYATQARLFRRLAFFVEKRGFRGRLLSDAELASRHGWNAHNYRPEGLAPFFTEAERQGFELNAEEELLRDILLANGIIRRTDGGYAPGEGGILSISQSSYPLLRELLVTHEAFHGVFYEEKAFRDGVRDVWEGLSDAERSYWRGLLSYMTYDPADEYLMINEFQSYLLQQPLDRARGYLRGTLAPRYARARPAQRGEIEQFLTDYPDTFQRSAEAVERVLRAVSPLEAGDVLLLRPADGEA